MSFDLVIKNGRIVTAETSFNADIGINGETIAAIGENLSGKKEINAEGKLVTPGAIDIHVHLEMPIGNYTSTDDFFTGTRAAAFGGTTAIVDFVETQTNETMLEALRARKALAAQRATIDYGFHMTIGPDDIAKLNQLPAIYDAGCATFKIYMAYGLRLNDGEILQAFQAIKNVGGLPVVHAENWDVITTLIAQNLAKGNTAPHWHPRSRPTLTEGESVGRLINLAEYVGLPVHIFHVGCQDSVDRIADARRRGSPVSAETCPQYLMLDDSVYDRAGVEGALPVCAPPIRPKGEQSKMWRALADNNLQIVTTDHCPFTREEKASGLGNFSTIPGGVPAIESRFNLLYSYGVRAGHFSENRWVDMACTTPAKLAGFTHKGYIAVGFDADLVIFDPQKTMTISPQTLHEKAGWTPYEGIEVTGMPAVTISRGEILVDNGEFLGRAGRGQFVKRQIKKG